MHRDAAVRPPGRVRPTRAVAALMLAMLVVQLAAQWCAWHCGAAGARDGAPFVAAGGGALASGPAAVAAFDAAGDPVAGEPAVDGPAGCGAVDWCEIGQTPPLAPGATARGALAASVPAPAPPEPIPSFLRIPEERPPTA
jgi:hypothetical protein